MMNDQDTYHWREGVGISLAEIKAQLGRLASDRESEKESILRVVIDLKDRDDQIERRLQKQLDANREYADRQFVDAERQLSAHRESTNRRFSDSDRYQRAMAAKVYVGQGMMAVLLAVWQFLKK